MTIAGVSRMARAGCLVAAVILFIPCGCTAPMPPSGNGNGNANSGDNANANGDSGDANTLSGGFVLEELGGALLSVTGTSETDVYAVGADAQDSGGPLVLHYDGSQWRRLETGLREGDLWWISLDTIDGEYYLVGDPGLILRYAPSTGSFEECETPGDEVLFGVWGASADDIWAVGGNVFADQPYGVIWHYDGEVWTALDTTTIDPAGLLPLFKVWGRSANEIYAVGQDGTLLRFDGEAWSPFPGDTQRTLFTVHGNDEMTVAVGGALSGVIEELEGDAFVDHADPMTPQMNGVFIPDSGAPFAAGFVGQITRRNDEGLWDVQQTSIDTIYDFHAVWVDPSGGVWAVGGDLSVNLDQGIVAYFGDRDVPTTVTP